MSKELCCSAKRLDGMFLSPIREFNEKAAALKEAGQDIVFFTMGEPDYDTPQDITEATIRSLQMHETHYAPMRGMLALRKTIGKMLEETVGLHYDPEKEIIITSGCAEALNNAIFSVVGPGDEVIIFEPAFMHYTNMVTAAGAKPVIVQTSLNNGYQIVKEDLLAAISDKTKMLIVNNPGNPTGAVYTKRTLDMLCEVACEKNLVVLADEIYNRIVYDGTKFTSIATLPGMRERTLLVNGFAKTYAMTGWRLGYVCAIPDRMQKIAVIHQYSTTCSPTFIQIGTAEGMETDGTKRDVLKMIDGFARRRDLMSEYLAQIEKLSFQKPLGAFYVLVDVSQTGLTGKEFAERLLIEKGVAVIPAIAFGKSSANSVRLSFATSDENIVKGTQRIKEFVLSLEQRPSLA